MMHSLIEALEPRIAPATLSINTGLSFEEGDSGTHTATFTVKLSAPATETVKVNYATIDGSAKDGINDGPTLADYTEQHGTLTFAAGELEKTISVAIVGDIYKELDEKFTVKLSGAEGATISLTEGTGEGTILNSFTSGNVTTTDTAVGILIGGVKVVEGNVAGVAGQHAAAFTVELTGPALDSDVTFSAQTLAASNDLGVINATPGVDFLALAKTTFTIAKNTTSTTVPVAVQGDLDFENGATESFRVEISEPVGAALVPGHSTGTGYIYGDDMLLSADQRTLKFMDVDGDVATVAVSKGRMSLSDFGFASAGTVGGKQLQTIDWLGKTQFANANLRITAEPAPGFPGAPNGTLSDGLVNVGAIVAARPQPELFQFTQGIDLGSIFVEGDLAKINAGDKFVTPAIRKLEVLSFGAVAGTLAEKLFSDSSFSILPQSFVLGPIKTLLVQGDFEGHLKVFGDQYGNINSLQIGGALSGADSTTADARGEGKILFTGTLGKATIGSIVGGSLAGSGRIEANLNTNAKINSLTVIHDVRGGIGAASGQISGERIGTVLIGGDLQGGAGIGSGTLLAVGTLGRLGNLRIEGNLAGSAVEGTDHADSNVTATSGSVFATTGIGNITILKDIKGGARNNSGLIFTNGTITSLFVGGNMTGSAAGHSGGVEAGGNIGPVVIKGNLQGGASGATALEFSGFLQGADIKSVTIEGDLISGTKGTGKIAVSGAIRALDQLGPLTIKGKVVGNAENPVLISALDFKTINLAVNPEKSVRFADILAGYGDPISVDLSRGKPLSADAKIGKVVIGGAVEALNLVAGVDAGADHVFGTIDDKPITENDEASVVSKIASIVINGTVVTNTASYGIVAQRIGSLTVNGSAVALGAPAVPVEISPGSNFHALLLGTTA